MSGTAGQVWDDLHFTARDGLKLYARRYPAPPSPRKPVLCLAGLTRNSRDFHDLAVALSRSAGGRTVYTIDCRGRGLSERDPDWRNYVVPIEMLDVLDFVTLAGLHGAAVIGTSRGGLIAMAMAVAQPTALGAVVLNDIGPVIELEGLMRIAGYVGKTPNPASWKEATELVATLGRRTFPAVSEREWEEVARQWFNEKDGRPILGYDPAIAKTVAFKGGQIPTLWPQFGALVRVPLLVVRGEHSDILSPSTVRAMQQRHPDCAVLTVAGQGHAPLLKDAASIAGIERFLAAADAGRPVAAEGFGATV
ncbi:MAG TPA: alpha/beta hydrolase [Hyphomicrobiaceae bacterium]|nr:alpha/beta hydrolase [Hyphomicrobiaceae bacterium]